MLPSFSPNSACSSLKVTWCAAFLECALVHAAPGSLQATALEAILEVAAGAPAAFAGGFRSKTGWLQGFLSHVNPVGEPSGKLALS